MNAITAIHPFKDEGLWVFDDANVGLVREPFVSGADEIIERMVQDIPDAGTGFTLLFSAGPFPGHQATLERRQEHLGGNWYHSRGLGNRRSRGDVPVTSTPLRSAAMRGSNNGCVTRPDSTRRS